MSISACDIRFSVLLSLLFIMNFIMLFFFFLVRISHFLTIPVAREKIKVKLALAIPTVAPTTLVNEMIDTPPLVVHKTIKILSI